jgi:hypothetical protein
MKECKFLDDLRDLYGEYKCLSESVLAVSIGCVDTPNLTFTCKLSAKMPDPPYTLVTARRGRSY